ncbi:hypothetical protein I549_0247 [Mycobacterium avium subsp. avium 2285 (R)]|nr:hypothetical protein I549_0247 [Mycobacterium avium subsp. avium 2285 (R)]
MPGMSTSYRPLITNATRSIHDDVRSARTRLRGTVELLEQGRQTGTDAEKLTAVIDDLRAVEQRLADLAHR